MDTRFEENFKTCIFSPDKLLTYAHNNIIIKMSICPICFKERRNLVCQEEMVQVQWGWDL